MFFQRLMHTRPKIRVPEYSFFTGSTILSLLLRMKSVNGTNAQQVMQLIDHICSEPAAGTSLIKFNPQKQRYDTKPGLVLYTETRLLPAIEVVAEQHENIVMMAHKLKQPQLPGQPFIADESFAQREFLVASADPSRIKRRVMQQEREITDLMVQIGAPIALPNDNTPQDILDLYEYNLLRLIDSNYDPTVITWLNFRPSAEETPKFKPK